ncbi:hypothetical protein VQ574_21310 (plasmid) [Stutzerimonas frequens]|uniref:hypothetical protein n=1 Tax=Stutzerimonas frequens TaxID=2968969 RepID=UPI002DBED2FF|nr:hypothetical protein [Stutzerimonas frequens]WRW29265.1 hypothetical protein VQ574_21310 [Stutzerimonas frequens]
MDIQQLFEAQFEQMRKQDQAKYFLMKVLRVDISARDTDAFRAIGVRIDNDQKVAVFSKKGPSGQHMPEVGGILRADKVSRIAAKSNDQVTAYEAEYFHAYRQDDYCIRAVAQAQRPRKDTKNNMWSAEMRFFDTESQPIMLNGANLEQEFENELLRLLKPWDYPEATSITHDVQGRSLWGDAEARPGFSPFVAVRSGNKTFYVFGSGSVLQQESRGNDKTYTLPTDDELRASIQRTTGVQNLLAIMNSIKSQATPEQLKQLKITLIPGLKVNVGRDSLGGEKQSYLAVPEAFDWKRQDITDKEGNAQSQPGYRMADVHIKMSRTGRMLVVDAAPSAGGGRQTQFIPETRPERELRNAGEAKQAETEQTDAQRATGTAPVPEQARQQEARQQQRPTQREVPNYDQPAPNSYDDIPEDFGDMTALAEDFVTMQQEPPHFDQAEDDIDLLLEEAANRQRARQMRPQM